MRRLGPLLLAATLVLAACENDSDDSSGPGAPASPSVPVATYEITISNMAFAPLNLAVPPGATVTVVNDDSVMHTVTSEAAAGNYAPGSVGGISFDTGPFLGQRSFSIPGDAGEGTVVPYYCAVHLGAMATPTGTITIRAAAAGAGRIDGGLPATGLDGGVAPAPRDAGGYAPPGPY